MCLGAALGGKGEGWKGNGRASLTFKIKRVLGQISFADIDNPMDVERDLLGVGTPVLVAKAVGEFAVRLCDEGLVTVGDGSEVDLILPCGVGDLLRYNCAHVSWLSGVLYDPVPPLLLRKGRGADIPLPRSQCRGCLRNRIPCLRPER